MELSRKRIDGREEMLLTGDVVVDSAISFLHPEWMECRRASLWLCARELHHLRPLLGLAGDVRPELLG